MKISIIVPVYNKIKYISETLNSIKSQSFKSFECILIDDGSNDGSEEICDQFSKNDSRFRVIHIPNEGVSHARNIGLDSALGEYVTFVDSDDILHVDYLNELYNSIVESNADMAICAFFEMSENGMLLNEKYYPFKSRQYEMADIYPNFSKYQKEYGVFGWCWGKIMPRSIVEGIWFDESLRLAEDFDFYLRVYPRVNSIYFNNNRLYYYRLQAENSSAIIDDNKIDYYSQFIINLHYKHFLDNHNQYKNQNKQIVDELLSNYAYFTLFHCEMSTFDLYFDQLKKTCEKEDLTLHCVGGFKKIVINCLNGNHKRAAVQILRLYGFVRRLIRGE